MRREWTSFSFSVSGIRCQIRYSRVAIRSLIWVSRILCRNLCVWRSRNNCRRYQVCRSVRRYIGGTTMSWPKKHDRNEAGWTGFLIPWYSLETNNAACLRCLRSLDEVWIILMHELKVNNEVPMIREWSNLKAWHELASGKCDGTPSTFGSCWSCNPIVR